MMNQQQVQVCDFQFDYEYFTRLAHKIRRVSCYMFFFKDLLLLAYVYVCLPYQYACYEDTFIAHREQKRALGALVH